MKNLYPKAIKKLLSAKKSLKAIISSWLNALKKDFSFYNKNTELLAIWTILFMTITGLFVIGVKSKISVTLLVLTLSFVITLITALLTSYYLHGIKYRNKKHLFSKAHNLFNKSFKVRSLLRFIKIPAPSLFTSPIKNFKHFINPLHY